MSYLAILGILQTKNTNIVLDIKSQQFQAVYKAENPFSCEVSDFFLFDCPLEIVVNLSDLCKANT